MATTPSLQETNLPSYLVEFDLGSILEYVRIGFQEENSKSKLTHGISDAPEKDPARFFPLLQRKWVSHMASPVPLNARDFNQHLGSRISRKSGNRFRVAIGDFEFKTVSLGEPLVTIFKKQKGQSKRGVLLSMHVSKADVEAKISAEMRFITSCMKKCKQHFVLSGMALEIDLLPSSNHVIVGLSYKLNMVTLFYRFFSSDISQALHDIVKHKMEPLPLKSENVYARYDASPKDNHLLYKVITDTTSAMPAVAQAFCHPSLQTDLLPFQRKSVKWLLSRESVEYNEDTRTNTYLPLISAELYLGLVGFPHANSDWLDTQIHGVFSRLCFGWKHVLYCGEKCWYNHFTGNLLLETQSVSFLKAFYEQNNSEPLPGCGLLSEEMGLGKTVEMTTLIQLHPRPLSEVDTQISLQFKEGGDYRYVKKAKTTLIAAPESIICQWYTEICQICPALLVTIYKGLGKYPELHNIPQYIAEFLQSYDIVLLNYSTLSRETDYANYSSRRKPTRGGMKRKSEDKEINGDSPEDAKESGPESALVDLYKAEFSNQSGVSLSQKKYERTIMTSLAKRIAQRDTKCIPHTQYYESPLMSCQWWRVVLDEVQMVSSGSTRAFATAALLPRFHSWGVSGTPSVLPAVLQFLRFLPFNYEIKKHCWKLLTSTDRKNSDFAELWLSLAIRHTKNMVYDDIRLPPQHRVLLTIPFTDVEQDKYKEVMDSTLGYLGIYDTQSALERRLRIDTSGYSHLRTWLFKLRQLCGNLQVGRLPKAHTVKGRNKTKILISGVAELKTLETVLIDMIEGVEDEVSECEKGVVNRMLEICLALEYTYNAELVIEVLGLLLPEIRELMAKAANQNELDRAKFRKLRSLLLRSNALPHENTNNDVSESEDDVFKSEILHNSIQNSDKREEIDKATNDDDDGFSFDDDPVLERLAEFLKVKERLSAKQLRLRAWKLTQHKCFFLLASAHFQVYDREFQAKIAQLRVPCGGVTRVLETIKQSGILREHNLMKAETVGDQFQTDENKEGGDEETNKVLEKKYYELAEECRRDILKHSIHEVHSVTAKRLANKGLISVDDWVNDGTKAFPKTTKKLFKAVPRIDTSKLTALVSNIRCKQVVDQLQTLVHGLNLQASMINENFDQLMTVLTNSLTNEDKDADGEEFEHYVQDQERASCLMFVLSQMLMDRANAVLESTTTVTEIERQQKHEFRQEVQCVSDRKFLKELQNQRLRVKPDTTTSVEECIEESRLLEIDLKSTKATPDRENSLGLLAMMHTIFENEKTSQNLLKKELNSSFNLVFNARVEYFRQLQQISDSVQNNAFKFPRDDADADTLDLLFQNLGRNLAVSQNKLTKSITRACYLATLLPSEQSRTSKQKQESVDENIENTEEVICIICQSAITVGSLTFCGHKFCRECLAEWLWRSPYCPMCKTFTDKDTVYGFTQIKNKFVKARALDGSHEARFGGVSDLHGTVNQIYKQLDEATLRKVMRVNLANSYGSKVDLIVKQVIYLRTLNLEVQIVVFSQWHDLLVILAFALDKMGISYVSARGSHIASSTKQNKDPVDVFKDRTTTTIKTCFLLNAQAQSSGLTLINAQHIFLCEPLINTSTELQAISRIHRIGQKKPTTVWMFAIANSVEENIVALGTNRRIEHLKANARESLSFTLTKLKLKLRSKMKQSEENDTVLGDTELRAAESFALTLGSSADKKALDHSEFVDDGDLHTIYFGAV